MSLRPQDAAGGRPFNNLLRRLNGADFMLIAPYFTAIDVNAGEVLYSPGDDVDPGGGRFHVPTLDE